MTQLIPDDMFDQAIPGQRRAATDEDFATAERLMDSGLFVGADTSPLARTHTDEDGTENPVNVAHVRAQLKRRLRAVEAA